MGGKARLSTLRDKLGRAHGLLVKAADRIVTPGAHGAEIGAAAEDALHDAEAAADLMAEVIDEVDG